MSKKPNDITMPSEVDEHVSLFDRFASWTSNLVSRAPFFAFCVLLIVIWLPSIGLFNTIDTWQLIINTVTTIITFLMVALLQNSQTRQDQATQHKLNAIARGLAALLDTHNEPEVDLEEDRKELLAAIGVEKRESA